jgi:hypothetical protein
MDTPFQVNFTVNGASRDEDMMVLMSGLLIFILVHLVPTQGELRSGLVTRFGDGAYKAAFSILPLVGLALCYRLRQAPGHAGHLPSGRITLPSF